MSIAFPRFQIYGNMYGRATTPADISVNVLTAQKGSFADVNTARLILQPVAAPPSNPVVGDTPYLYVVSGTPPELYFGTDQVATNSSVPSMFSNLGNGARIFSLPEAGIRSVTSSDGSMTITETANEIDVGLSPTVPVVKSLGHSATPPVPASSYSICRDTTPVNGDVVLNWLTDDTSVDGGIVWTAGANYLTAKATLSGVTLGSAGGSHSLVTDGTGPLLGIKGLTAGVGINLVPDTDHITIESTFDGSKWTSSAGAGAVLLSQKIPSIVSNLMWKAQNGTNIINTTFSPTNSVILGGTGNVLTAGTNNNIFGGTSHLIAFNGSYATGSLCQNNLILGGEGVTIRADCGTGTTVCTDNTILSSQSWIGSDSTTSTRECGIVGGTYNNIISDAANSSILRSNIYGGHDNWMYTFTGGTQMEQCAIIGGENTYLYNSSKYCYTLGGSFEIVSRVGCVMVGDWSYTPGPFGPSTDNEYTGKFAGGYRLFTASDLTTGMTMAPGASSWTAVSDVNKKDIHGEVDYGAYLDKLVSLPVYEYNYKGTPREQRCVGPTAQDYHALFGCECITKEIEEDVVTGREERLVGERTIHVPISERVKKTVTCPAKDPLGIEQQDLIGICIAAIKALDDKFKRLEAAVLQ